MISPRLQSLVNLSKLHMAVAGKRPSSFQSKHRLVASLAHDLYEQTTTPLLSDRLPVKSAMPEDASKIVTTGHKSRTINFIDPRGYKHAICTTDGETILDIAKSMRLDIEGACEGECACSTCHVIIASKAEYEKLPPSTEKEEDMLDLAFGLTSTSRLACQLRMTADLDQIRILLPGSQWLAKAAH